MLSRTARYQASILETAVERRIPRSMCWAQYEQSFFSSVWSRSMVVRLVCKRCPLDTCVASWVAYSRRPAAVPMELGCIRKRSGLGTKSGGDY